MALGGPKAGGQAGALPIHKKRAPAQADSWRHSTFQACCTGAPHRQDLLLSLSSGAGLSPTAAGCCKQLLPALQLTSAPLTLDALPYRRLSARGSGLTRRVHVLELPE